MTVSVEPELQLKAATSPVFRPRRGTMPAPGAMNKDSRIRFAAVALALVTLAAGIFGWINFQKEREYQVPTDGIWWVSEAAGLVAQRVDPSGPGEKAGIRAADRLILVNERPVPNMAALGREQFRTGQFLKAKYTVERRGVQLETPVILAPLDRSQNAGLRLIALVYLGIGLYVLLRRWTAPKSMHFYIFCLVSFVFYGFHYTGKLNTFDQIIFWANVVAGVLQPTLFLHFVLTFPEKREFVRRRPWLQFAIYLPGLLLLCAHGAAFLWFQSTERLNWNLN